MTYPLPPMAIRAGALGDMLMFLPVIDALAAHHHCNKVDVITAGWASAQLLQHSPCIGDILVVPGTRNRPAWLSPAKRKAIHWLKDKHPKQLYLFERKDKLLDIVHAAGFAEQTHRLANWPHNLQKHQIDDYIDFFSPDLAQDDDIRFPTLNRKRLPLLETQHWLDTKAMDQSRPLVLLQAGNRRTARGLRVQRSSNVKYWSPENWAKVIAAIKHDLPDANVILCGSAQEHSFNEKIITRTKNPTVYNAAKELPLDRLMALCALAHSMISVDTGPAHIAGALACPLVVLFGPTSPIRHAPRSKERVTIVTDKGIALRNQDIIWSAQCEMMNIDPTSVVDAWRQTFSV